MIIGEPFSGKTTIYRILAKAIGLQSKRDKDDGINVQLAGKRSI